MHDEVFQLFNDTCILRSEAMYDIISIGQTASEHIQLMDIRYP